MLGNQLYNPVNKRSLGTVMLKSYLKAEGS
jgi:hypothetical protein